ncbi:hypothetical protein SHKM778_58450 [Streptomyces sp. KM77-8]|uniref:Uncharacterized protein n=1 Tax=Streptomyces haneummycinicus TaxID=3074435 RepID=A0AAT9HPG4_9ACTN
MHTLDTLDAMTQHQSTQTMKPATAAKKLGVYLDATPADFREGVVSRTELNTLQSDPPQWLRDLRRDGPHPARWSRRSWACPSPGSHAAGSPRHSPPSRSRR